MSKRLEETKLYKEFNSSYKIIDGGHEVIMVSRNVMRKMEAIAIYKALDGIDVSIVKFYMEDEDHIEEANILVDLSLGRPQAEDNLKEYGRGVVEGLLNIDFPLVHNTLQFRYDLDDDLDLWLDSEDLCKGLRDSLIFYTEVYNKIEERENGVSEVEEENLARMIFNLGMKVKDINSITIESKETYAKNALIKERIDIKSFINSFFNEDQQIFAETAMDFKVELLAHLLNKAHFGEGIHLVLDTGVAIVKYK